MADEYTPAEYGTPRNNHNAKQHAWTTVATLDVIAEPIVIPGMPQEWQSLISRLLAIWYGKLGRNRVRRRYYDGKNRLKDFGISTPPQLLDVETVVGWPQKAVDALAVRSRFDGFSANDPVLGAQIREFRGVEEACQHVGAAAVL
jgi:hypothetical protein